MKDALVEIVIPVFNGAPYLAECLQSIVNQTHRCWQAVVVNNCSTDGTAAIADDYCRRDSRIRALHFSEFLVQSENYNRALAQVSTRADYVKILEADNWITPDCLQRTVEVAEDNPQVGIVGAYWLRGNRVDGSGLYPLQTVLDGAEVCRLLFRQRIYLLGTPSTLLFRRCALAVDLPWFRPGRHYDDLDLCIRVFRKWHFAYVHQVLAFVRDDNNGMYSEVRKNDHEAAYRYFLIHEYGHEWFENDELQEIRDRCRRDYFDRLGAAILAQRNDSYWNLHRQLWRNAGSRFHRWHFFVPLVRSLLERLLNPLATTRGWLHRRRERRKTLDVSTHARTVAGDSAVALKRGEC